MVVCDQIIEDVTVRSDKGGVINCDCSQDCYMNKLECYKESLWLMIWATNLSIWFWIKKQDVTVADGLVVRQMLLLEFREQQNKTQNDGWWQIKSLMGKTFTLSISENSILSSGVQLRPMGEMFIIPFLNSMNVPLWAESDPCSKHWEQLQQAIAYWKGFKQF